MATTYAEYTDADSEVLDVPNPRVTDDDYFHGPNPVKVGFGTRTLAHEGGGLDLSVNPGESTADVQHRNEGQAGWNQQAGTSSSASSPTGEPDESWRNDDLRGYADERGIDVPSNATKKELLEAIRGS